MAVENSDTDVEETVATEQQRITLTRSPAAVCAGTSGIGTPSARDGPKYTHTAACGNDLRLCRPAFPPRRKKEIAEWMLAT